MKHAIYGMSNLRKSKTGIPNGVIIWVSQKYGSHGPRVKVSNFRDKAKFEDADCWSVSISETPEVVAGEPLGFSAAELKKVMLFVTRNNEVLLKYWDGKLFTEELEAQIKKV